jgi:ring-1,2-phenylacetyl-CoA epoxidase subunit PaaD
MNVRTEATELERNRLLVAAWNAASSVPDPEIPVVTVSDLGILRSVDVDDEGRATAFVTPTYSGCPATRLIEQMVLEALQRAGFADSHVESVLSPAWTTDWISAEGREKLRRFGIAPPQNAANSKLALFGETAVRCPHCNNERTERISEFGSTPCKALYRCISCREPFDYFKCL